MKNEDISDNVSKILKDIHRNIYNNDSPSGMFDSGNVGLTILSMSIVEASKNIKDGMIELSKAITNKGDIND